MFGQLAINRHYSNNSRIGPVTWRIVVNSETIREVSNQPARSWLTGYPETDSSAEVGSSQCPVIIDDSGVNDDNGLSRSYPGGPVVDGRRTRGNELVVWIDDEKRRDLFAELQMCHDAAPSHGKALSASRRPNC